MRCNECATEMTERTTTPQTPYRYSESGLKKVALVGVKVSFCPTCKTETVVIPKIGQLNALIAKILMGKPDFLSGEELRYLRKYAGFPSNKFAALLDVDPSYLSRIENGKDKSEHLGGSVDKLARALVSAARDQEYTKNILLQLAADRIEDKDRKKNTEFPTLRLVRNRWQQAA